jgi:hypothetical protein
MSLDAATAESLLAFWADAGVDGMLLDEPVDRIAAGKIAPPVAAARTAAVGAPPAPRPRRSPPRPTALRPWPPPSPVSTAAR